MVKGSVGAKNVGSFEEYRCLFKWEQRHRRAEIAHQKWEADCCCRGSDKSEIWNLFQKDDLLKGCHLVRQQSVNDEKFLSVLQKLSQNCS